MYSNYTWENFLFTKKKKEKETKRVFHLLKKKMWSHFCEKRLYRSPIYMLIFAMLKLMLYSGTLLKQLKSSRKGRKNKKERETKTV